MLQQLGRCETIKADEDCGQLDSGSGYTGFAGTYGHACKCLKMGRETRDSCYNQYSLICEWKQSDKKVM